MSEVSKAKWKLHISSCHEGAKFAGDSQTWEGDSLEECEKNFEIVKTFVRSQNCEIWSAEAIGPGGEKYVLREPPNR